MKAMLTAIGCAMALGVVGAGLGRSSATSIEGTYELTYRELPNGDQMRPPEIIGLINFTKDRRNLNIYWKEDGKPISVSTISQYTLSDTEYTEQSIYSMMHNEAEGKGVKYDLERQRGSSPVTAREGRVEFQPPFRNEPKLVFTKEGFTATRDGEFVDHWRKVD